MANLAHISQPLVEGFALPPSVLTDPNLQVISDGNDASDEELKRCRSLKPGPLGCKAYHVEGSDYCIAHKTMIDKEGQG